MESGFISIGQYLIERLYELGIRHIFGVPGDFVLGFYDLLVNSKIKVINMCDEQRAGFAADAYARVNGVGAVCVTYCVGGLKIANPTAGAFAEKSPLIVISGSPGIRERRKDPLLHHKVRDFDTQLRVFNHVTISSTVLDDPQTAAKEIDRVLDSSLQHKRPVYIEIPRDMVSQPLYLDKSRINGKESFSDPEKEKDNSTVLNEALMEVISIIKSSKKLAILAGVELHRYGLQDKLVSIVEKFQIPVASTLSSKSVISEIHPLYLGLYEGAMGHDNVRDYVESSDCLILLGAFVTDLDLGGLPSKIDPANSISITSEKVSIKYHNFEGIRLEDFIRGMADSNEIGGPRRVTNLPYTQKSIQFSAIKGKKITINRLFQCLDSFLKNNMIVLADVGDALFGSTDLVIHNKTEFLSSAYYASMGFAVPASIGAQFANPKLRPLVIVGDGAFQMTGMEISTSYRFNLNPIVLVLDNQGYGTERSILDGHFNDIPMWDYSKILKLIGGGIGYLIETEEQFEDSLLQAERNKESFSILDIRLDRYDKSTALQRLTDSLRKSAI
ncbi:Indole-3-pyruvate decarboxylase [Candidatus Nitrosocosmicus oleophilus]|uniref:Indole-3-pyruvate decarboxylase n=1 Tax=Candidatus Nitrosocosmicus oleophilus TaxID=1353260 RepID=A0A654M4D1_9ARCH|nr:thiamine pyrophosphate-binding protein [Candidatus Nitrosocosmicus oleophilus]ALI37349.1 Indole-3-pyruvate decarboxylase [Candidatus Nitrosocosmicus oleophilus]